MALVLVCSEYQPMTTLKEREGETGKKVKSNSLQRKKHLVSPLSLLLNTTGNIGILGPQLGGLRISPETQLSHFCRRNAESHMIPNLSHMQ